MVVLYCLKDVFSFTLCLLNQLFALSVRCIILFGCVLIFSLPLSPLLLTLSACFRSAKAAQKVLPLSCVLLFIKDIVIIYVMLLNFVSV